MNLKVDGDGFLIDRDDWNEEVMHELAEMKGLKLTEDMVELVHKVRAMYEAEGMVPPLRVFSKATGGDRKGTHLNKLFNGGPMKVLARVGGLPKPTGCV